jgi:iron(III) transport system substrate-binding protein
MRSLHHRLAALCATLGLALASCGSDPDLVVYCSLDQEFAEPLIREYQERSGLDIRVEYDVEANKNVGLALRVREEVARPRCDVFWSNEFAMVVALAEDGLLEAYDSPSAASLPAEMKDPDHRWHGFAARGRVFIVNTNLVDPGQIDSWDDLLDPRHAGKVAMARPLAGTTLTHMAALHEVLPPGEARRFLESVDRLSREGRLNLANGNAHVMRLVSEGQCAFGWTDTDDFHVALEKGAPVQAVYPDQGGIGTMLIPNTICIPVGAPRKEAARRFIDWALSEEVEARLAASRSAQIPVRPSVARPAHVKAPGEFQPMRYDLRTVGLSIRARAAEFQELFLK